MHLKLTGIRHAKLRFLATGVAFATAVLTAAINGGPASAFVDPFHPEGPLNMVVRVQNTQEGASARLIFRDGHAQLAPSLAVTPFSRYVYVSGAGEAIVEATGAGPEGVLTKSEVETGWIVACQIEVKNFLLSGGLMEGSPARVRSRLPAHS